MEEHIYELQENEMSEKTSIIVGNDEIRDNLKAIAFIVFDSDGNHEKNSFLDINGNILLYGKPGVGKTSISYELAHHIKEHYKASFYNINLSSIISEKLGKTSKELNRFFTDIIEKCSKYKVVLLIEEIEAFLPDRNSTKELEDMKRALTVFMHYLDKKINNLMIIATTNHIDALDKAIARRFSYVYEINCKEEDIFINFLTHPHNPFKDNFINNKLNSEITSILIEKELCISDLKFYMRKIYLKAKDVSAIDLLDILKGE